MASTEEIIGQLPESLRAIARRYIKVLASMSKETIEQLITDLYASDNWWPAYQRIVVNMSTEDLDAEQERIEQEFTEANNAPSKAEDFAPVFVSTLLKVALLVAQAAIS